MSKKIVSYRTLYQPDGLLEKLDDEVNNLLDKGWQPYGEHNYNGIHVCQVMVRYEEDGEDSK